LVLIVPIRVVGLVIRVRRRLLLIVIRHIYTLTLSKGIILGIIKVLLRRRLVNNSLRIVGGLLNRGLEWLILNGVSKGLLLLLLLDVLLGSY